MTQVPQTVRPPAPGSSGAPQAAPSGRGTVASVSGAKPTGPGAAGREIPRQLRRIRLVSVVVALTFAGLTLLQLLLAGQALQSAAKDTQQLVRVQNIKVHLLRADALATNAFLVGGLEAPEQRENYDRSLGHATHAIAEAAEAQPLDRDVLVELNQVIVDYAEGMAQARSTNRQGLPVGAGYLRASSSELRDRGVVLVDALVAANTERAGNSLNAHLPLLMALPALAALVIIALINRWIARRFKRHINTGLAGAALVILLVGIAATALSAVQAGTNAGLRDADYATAVNGSEARSAANAAKTNESLRLISRGSGQAYETAWQEQADRVTAALKRSELRSAPTDPWETYLEGHGRVVALDEQGDWDAAVALATNREPGAPTTVFGSFDAGMEDLVTQAAGRTSSTLLGGRIAFILVSVLAVLGGLLAAGLAWRGVTARLEEYA